MKLYIKPRDWVVDSEHTNFCCKAFKGALTYTPPSNLRFSTSRDEVIKSMWIDYDGKSVKSIYGIINFCPFCGEKVEIEKKVD